MSAPARYITTDEYPSPAGISPITAERYISADYMAREHERVWNKNWLFAGLLSDLQEPGDYIVLNVARESIIVSRTQNGELAANYNVCQHRGARVLVNDIGSLEKFVCPYHGWAYEPDGSLVHAPDPDRFSQGVPFEQLSLKPVRVDAWGGMAWVCMDEDAEPLADFLEIGRAHV